MILITSIICATILISFIILSVAIYKSSKNISLIINNSSVKEIIESSTPINTIVEDNQIINNYEDKINESIFEMNSRVFNNPIKVKDIKNQEYKSREDDISNISEQLKGIR